jgi:2-amino-4-hydroxy-6-hydroxymethyldihydropteridine diphosphokinase
MNADDSATKRAAIHEVCLSLGSNLGDRDANLRAALRALAMYTRITLVSSVYETEPLIVEDQPHFHNIACAGSTALEPLALLHALKRIEAELGRVPGPRYGPRLIDIDILLFDDLILRTPELTIPHAALLERAFALVPLAEITPERRHPVAGHTLQELASGIDAEGVRRLGAL